jgi:hypothetical protein
MSSETDSFNNHDGLIVLEDGGQWEGEFVIGIEQAAASAAAVKRG